ncbi:hypothetical protein LAZ67_8001107 [Cordylochernes scorpioides]|uniref:Reverse transcriptase domain-containing protein n=1 Tax=Cordylochernes scorpioides TaxID=51811 RepID=A0ABY6KPX0_9ARAC|nr:hypothetical protein LAZ67_8001107 [Cordylochernes scorpioides]
MVCGLQLNLPHKILLESLTDGHPSLISALSLPCNRTPSKNDQNNSQPFLRTVTEVQCSATVVSTTQLRCQSTLFTLQNRPRPVYRATTYPQHERTVLSSPAPFRVTNTRAHVTCSPYPLYSMSPAQAVNSNCPRDPPTTAPDQACSDPQDSTTIGNSALRSRARDDMGSMRPLRPLRPRCNFAYGCDAPNGAHTERRPKSFKTRAPPQTTKDRRPAYSFTGHQSKTRQVASGCVDDPERRCQKSLTSERPTKCRVYQEGTTDRRVRSPPPQCTIIHADNKMVSMAVTDRSFTSRTVAQHIHRVVGPQDAHCSVYPLRRITDIIFTDESRFSLHYHDVRIRVWRHRGERRLNSCVMHRHTGPALGIMTPPTAAVNPAPSSSNLYSGAQKAQSSSQGKPNMARVQSPSGELKGFCSSGRDERGGDPGVDSFREPHKTRQLLNDHLERISNKILDHNIIEEKEMRRMAHSTFRERLSRGPQATPQAASSLRDCGLIIVPKCQTYDVPGRSSWNIACVSDEVALASKNRSPLAVISTDLESAFDTLDRSFLMSLMISIRMPPGFIGWFLLLYAGADAAVRINGFYNRTSYLLNDVKQGVTASAAFSSLATGPLLHRLEQLLGPGNVLAYVDDIALLIRKDGQFELVKFAIDEFRRASGIHINLGRSKGLWCGALEIAPTLHSTTGAGNSAQENHITKLFKTAIAKGSHFVRGLFLIPSHSLTGALCLGTSAYCLTAGRPPCKTSLPRFRRLLELWEAVSEILAMNLRVLPLHQLQDLHIIGDCRFFRPPDLLIESRWVGVCVGEITGSSFFPLHTTRTRATLADVAALTSFCGRLCAIVLRGTVTAFQRLTTRTTRHMLERPRLAALSITHMLCRWLHHVIIPISTSLSSLRRSRVSCIACGSGDLSLAHRYWYCRSVIVEAFTIIQRFSNMRGWIFGNDLEDDALAILAGPVGHWTRYGSRRILLLSWLPGELPLWMCPAPSPGPTCFGTASRGTTQMSPYG